MKKLIKKICILLVIVLTLIAPMGQVFEYKTTHRGTLQDGLYLANEQYDVVLMGGSHMNGGLDPNVLWEQGGITSFNFATGGQPLDTTYYLLKDVLKKQQNPIVVLDVFYLGMTEKYGDLGLVSGVIDNMNFSANKLNAIWNCAPLSERLTYLFPVLKYHFRWPTLTATDFSFDCSSVYYTKGFSAGTNRYGKENSGWEFTDNRLAIPQKPLEYLDKIVALCKADNCQLMFVNFPCDYEAADQESGWVNDCEALFNTVSDYAKANGIPFLDLYDQEADLGLDFANDMNNSGHLNIWGACKVSSYFTNYLEQNYNLTDHRSDSAYAQWNDDYEKSQAASVL